MSLLMVIPVMTLWTLAILWFYRKSWPPTHNRPPSRAGLVNEPRCGCRGQPWEERQRRSAEFHPVTAPPRQQGAPAAAFSSRYAALWSQHFRAGRRPWRRAAGRPCEQAGRCGDGVSGVVMPLGCLSGLLLPSGTPCSSWAAPSCGFSAPTSSC